ncbi:MAG: phosphoribosylformylglycinamidine synthase subunit PurS [Chitinophagales bacterium]|nr:phosphoribosylformylglycinamidine synthase subunit PurS [Chitinophagales bacterium]MDW8274363.1 phosphoribosylformylglycinamidine synthase subunit PurS [Chitinophagales bacterium]
MPHKELLDPQGKAVANGLHKLGFNGVDDVRVGKHIVLTLTAQNDTEARDIVEQACKKLLANEIIEAYSFVLHTEG